MAKHRLSHNFYVLPLIAVALTTCLPGCSPPDGANQAENPFETKDIPKDKSNKDDQEANCGEHKCGGGLD